MVLIIFDNFKAFAGIFSILLRVRVACFFNIVVPTESMTMAFVEPDECISIFYLYIFFFFLSFLDFMSRVAVIWISSPELSYVCHTYAIPICAPMWAENS